MPLQTYEKRFAEFPFLFIFIISWLRQGIIDSTETETCQIYFRMPVKAKFYKDLITPTIDGQAVCVRYVFSTPVVLDARLNN